MSKIHGITRLQVADQPTFAKLAPTIFKLLNGRVWAGHNVADYDIPILAAEFRRAEHPMPECAGVVDTLIMSRTKFRNHRGLANHKLQTLAQYFDVLSPGKKQTHRAMDDVRVNIATALRMCAIGYLRANFEFVQPVLDYSLPTTPSASPARSNDGEHKESLMQRMEKWFDETAPAQTKLHTTQREICRSNTVKGRRCKNMSVNTEVGLCALHLGLRARHSAEKTPPATTPTDTKPPASA